MRLHGRSVLVRPCWTRRAGLTAHSARFLSFLNLLLWAQLTGGVRLKVQMTRFVQAVLATIPVLLTPVLIYALAEGILDFGGGEKDILLAAPWLIWSATFALCSYVLIYRRWLVRKWVLRSGIVSTGLLLGLGLILYAISF